MSTPVTDGITALLPPKAAWTVVVGLAVVGLGGGGSAVATLMQTTTVAEQQPEIQRSLDRMDREMTDLRDRDKLLGDQIDVLEDKNEQRHRRITRDLDDLDRQQIDIQNVLDDICESDRNCRKRRKRDP